MSAGDIVLFRASTEDLVPLLALERATEHAPHWSAEVWRDVLCSASATNEPAQSSPDRLVLLARRQQHLAGFVAVSMVAGVAEIESLGVAEAQRRTGVARALCEASVAWAAERQAHAVQLEVRASNAAALTLYRSLGFCEQGRRPGYYKAPEEDALLLARVVPIP